MFSTFFQGSMLRAKNNFLELEGDRSQFIKYPVVYWKKTVVWERNYRKIYGNSGNKKSASKRCGPLSGGYLFALTQHVCNLPDARGLVKFWKRKNWTTQMNTFFSKFYSVIFQIIFSMRVKKQSSILKNTIIKKWLHAGV